MKKTPDIGSDLEKMKGQRAFSVPDHYFERVTDEILHSIELEEQPSRFMERPKRVFMRYIYAAAALIGILMVSYLGIRIFFNEQPGDHMSQVEVMEYIEFYSGDVNESVVHENLGTTLPVDDISDEQKDAIIILLLNEGIDELTIFEEL